MCESCEVVRINGRVCHEQGCPDAWKDEKRECRWCGRMFKPENARDEFCDSLCRESYFG